MFRQCQKLKKHNAIVYKVNTTSVSNRLLYKLLHIGVVCLYFVNALSSSRTTFSLLLRPIDRGDILANEPLASTTCVDRGQRYERISN